MYLSTEITLTEKIAEFAIKLLCFYFYFVISPQYMTWLTGVDMWDLYAAKIINLGVLGINYKMSSVSHVYLPTNEQRLK